MGQMQQTLYSMVKVNNEIELCEVGDMDCKQAIERELLQNRISYFIRWNKGGLFRLGRKKDYCIFCVNDNAAEEAEADDRIWPRPAERTRQGFRTRSRRRKQCWRDRCRIEGQAFENELFE